MQTSPPTLLGEARIAELVHSYLIAEYRWELDGHWLNLRIGEPTPEIWSQFPNARSIGLITAWDPQSLPRAEPVNRQADQMLHRELLDAGLHCRAAFSSAANRSWREPSWLVAGMAMATFDALSRRYGQLATLFWTPDTPVRMRVDAARPLNFKGDHAIDWLK
jgi:Protein of unknown function (DUF3293)